MYIIKVSLLSLQLKDYSIKKRRGGHQQNTPDPHAIQILTLNGVNNEERWLLVVDVVEVHDAGGGHQLQDVEAVADGQAAVIELAALFPLAAGVAGARPLIANLPQLVHGQQADVPAGQDQVKVTLQGLLDFRAHQRVQAKVGQGRVRVDLAHILYAWQSKTVFEICFLVKAFFQVLDTKTALQNNH